MKKTLLTILATAAAISASAAEPIELLTNGDGTTLDGWNYSGFAVQKIEYSSGERRLLRSCSRTFERVFFARFIAFARFTTDGLKIVFIYLRIIFC